MARELRSPRGLLHNRIHRLEVLEPGAALSLGIISNLPKVLQSYLGWATDDTYVCRCLYNFSNKCILRHTCHMYLSSEAFNASVAPSLCGSVAAWLHGYVAPPLWPAVCNLHSPYYILPSETQIPIHSYQGYLSSAAFDVSMAPFLRGTEGARRATEPSLPSGSSW